jgi:hypothetical protein
VALASALGKNTTLTSLALVVNTIGPVGDRAFQAALADGNKTLLDLNGVNDVDHFLIRNQRIMKQRREQVR